MNNFGEKVSFIWSVADLLRGPYKPPQYGRVILPLTVLRRLDCVLEPTKEKVLAKGAELKGGKVSNAEPILNRVAKASFHNTSKLDFKKLKGEPDKIAANLTAYIKGFSSRVRDIFEKFNFEPEIARLEENDRLYLVVSKFADFDLHPDRVSNIEMGYVFEELIRRFNEAANETAGDHFTPREVIRLMVNLLFAPDRDLNPGMHRVPALCEQLLLELLQMRLGRADDVPAAFLFQELDVVFRHHAAVHHPDAVALAIPRLHCLDDVLDSGHVGRVPGEHFIAQRHPTTRHDQSNADLFAVAALVAGIASLRQRIAIRLAFKESAGDVVEQQVVFEIEEFAEPVLEMSFERCLVREQLIQRAIESVVIHVLLRNSQQFRQGGLGIPLLGGLEFAGRFQQAGDYQNQGTQRPRDGCVSGR